MEMPEKEILKEKMESFETRCTQIIELIGDKSRLIGDEQQQAKELLRSLKNDLRAACHDLELRRDRLSHLEFSFFRPGVTKASAAINVSVGNVPDHRWVSELCEAQAEIRHYRRNLEDFVG